MVTTVPVTSVKGQNAKFSKMNGLYDASGSSAAISKRLADEGGEKLEAALWLLDWLYSDEGHMINCFGIEGESYNMVDGYPTFTDIVLNNADGLNVAAALSIYARGHQNGPVVQDTRVNDQYYSYTAQIAGMHLWTKTDFGEYMYPAGAAIATDDADDFATITANIKTYKEEMEAKWITGQQELTDEERQQIADEHTRRIVSDVMGDYMTKQQEELAAREAARGAEERPGLATNVWIPALIAIIVSLIGLVVVVLILK
jgi:putative aldouronate transport system substrate-binding protein